MNPNSSSRVKAQPLRSRLREVATTQILEAAEQVFSEMGLHEAKMETIAARAGVAVGTLYNHFKDRHALLAALVDARRDSLVAALDGSLASHQDEPFAEQLRSFVVAFLSFCEERSSLAALMAEAEPSSALRKQKEAAGEAINQRAHELLKRGFAAKALSVESMPVLHVLFRGMLRGAVEEARARPQSRRTPAAWARDISALLLRGGRH